MQSSLKRYIKTKIIIYVKEIAQSTKVLVPLNLNWGSIDRDSFNKNQSFCKLHRALSQQKCTANEHSSVGRLTFAETKPCVLLCL